MCAILIPIILTLLILGLFIVVEYPRLTTDNSPAFLLSLLLTGDWMAASMLLEARSTSKKPASSITPRPMTSGEVNFITVLMWNMLAYLLLIISATPFWLEPDYVRGSLQNILDILSYVMRVM